MNIHFLYPGFLYALGFLSIPVVIHLFNFRRYRKVYFSNVRFLKSVKQKTRAKSQVKHLIVLLLRLMMITALALAFAQPYIPVSENYLQQPVDVAGIYLDNSFSMDAESKYGNLLDVARNKAKEIIDSYRPGTRFLLVTNDLSPKHQHLVNKEQLLEYITESDVSPALLPMSKVFVRQQDFLKSPDNLVTGRKNIYLLSDFQKVSTDLENIENDTSLFVHLIPLTTQPTKNLYIDSCWFENPVRMYNKPEELFVKIVNNTGESYQNIPVELYINDSLKAVSSINIDQNTSQKAILTYTNSSTGIQQARISISDYPITYDNDFYFSYTIADNINILLINEKVENPYINALFRDDPYFRITGTSVTGIDYSKFSDFRLIVLNGLKSVSSGLCHELLGFLHHGGSVVIFPGTDIEPETYNSLLQEMQCNLITGTDTQKTKIKDIAYQHFIFRNAFEKEEDNIDLPVIHRHYLLGHLTQTRDQAVLTTQNNHKILITCDYGKGRAYIFTISGDAESSNFMTHALFVPTLYNIALNSQPSSDIYYIIGEKSSIELTGRKQPGSNVLHVYNKRRTFDIVPRDTVEGNTLHILIDNEIQEAGNYCIESGKEVLSGISFNYNRKESDLSCYSSGEIEELIHHLDLDNFSLIENTGESLTRILQHISQGLRLWKWLVVIALLCIAAEIAVLRLWR
ncbi:MAG: BatA domain-containing protein [Bacteroidetes bacterium]|nr:BatA domain-containing protein [Bacteroidota bacterium]